MQKKPARAQFRKCLFFFFSEKSNKIEEGKTLVNKKHTGAPNGINPFKIISYGKCPAAVGGIPA
jgi:hypothetical protein